MAMLVITSFRSDVLFWLIDVMSHVTVELSFHSIWLSCFLSRGPLTVRLRIHQKNRFACGRHVYLIPLLRDGVKQLTLSVVSGAGNESGQWPSSWSWPVVILQSGSSGIDSWNYESFCLRHYFNEFLFTINCCRQFWWRCFRESATDVSTTNVSFWFFDSYRSFWR